MGGAGVGVVLEDREGEGIQADVLKADPVEEKVADVAVEREDKNWKT